MVEDSKHIKKWRKAVLTAAQLAMSVEWTPIGVPVVLECCFRFSRPDSHRKKDGSLRLGKPLAKVSKPDLSKLIRAVEDSLTDAGAWTDDSIAVGYGNTIKRYCDQGEPEGVELAISVCDHRGKFLIDSDRIEAHRRQSSQLRGTSPIDGRTDRDQEHGSCLDLFRGQR